MAQTSTTWKPNRRQQKVLEAAQEAGLNRTICQVCEDAGVPRHTFYNWMGKPEFAQAWDDVWRRAIVRHMPSVVSAVMYKAQKGDVAAARLLADMVGAITKKHEVTSPVDIVLVWDDPDVENNSPEAT